MKKYLLVAILAAGGYYAWQFAGTFKSKVDTALTPEPVNGDNTAPLVAADLAGYNGKALRKTVQNLKKVNDAHVGAINQKVELNSD